MIRPIITEKTLTFAQRGWYTFAVQTHMRKEEIARSIQEVYGVSVVETRTIAMHGKVKRAGKAMRTVTKPDWKKALVKLKKGQRIDAFEVTEKETKSENQVPGGAGKNELVQKETKSGASGEKRRFTLPRLTQGDK